MRATVLVVLCLAATLWPSKLSEPVESHEVPSYCYDDGTGLYFPCQYVKHPDIDV